MRKALITLAAVAALAAGVAQAQTSNWAYFEAEGGLMQAGVQTAGGEQLILKCDERGNGSVFGVIFTPERLRPPSDRPQMREIRMRFDQGSTEVVSWRYYEHTAMALNSRRDRQLPEFLTDLADAEALEVVLNPVDGAPVTIRYTVAGAREAIDRVYESCGDSNNPLS